MIFYVLQMFLLYCRSHFSLYKNHKVTEAVLKLIWYNCKLIKTSCIPATVPLLYDTYYLCYCKVNTPYWAFSQATQDRTHAWLSHSACSLTCQLHSFQPKVCFLWHVAASPSANRSATRGNTSVCS